MDANDDKINSVVALGRELIAENNYASDKIQQKADSLEDRYVLFLSGGNKLFDFFTEYIYNGKFKCHWWPKICWKQHIAGKAYSAWCLATGSEFLLNTMMMIFKIFEVPVFIYDELCALEYTPYVQ